MVRAQADSALVTDGGVAVPVAGPLPCGVLEALNLLFGQILSRPKLRILCGELSGLRWLRGWPYGRISSCDSILALFSLSVNCSLYRQ
jgi:hypothetical protein